MIDMKEAMSLESRIGEFLDKINDMQEFYCHNEEVLDIYEGNLLEYVEKLMQETLDKRYFNQIRHRVLPINFIQKIVDKLAKSYAESPMRKAEDQDFVDFYTRAMDLDSQMMLAEEYSHLNKGYALKPKLTNKGRLKMDVLPYDKFLVIADDNSDQMCPTVFIEFLGKTERQIIDKNQQENIEIVEEYIAYSDTEIIAFDNSGNKIPHYTESINDINPIGMIPFVYGNRSKSNIVPKQDKDFLKLSKILPLMLSDVNGAIMFQCFTLIYGIDVEFNDAKMNPNAIWDLSSREKSDKTAQIGTLQPSVDSDKALTFFKNILAMWLDSKGIDAGSIMNLDSQTIASGLSKAMDELDTTEARKKSIGFMSKEEKALFKLLARLNNYWMKLPMSKGLNLRIVNEEAIDESIEIEFKEPMAKLDYTTEVNNSINMLNNGLSYREKEIKRLHPYISEDEINLIFEEAGYSRIDPEEATKAQDERDMEEDVLESEPDVPEEETEEIEEEITEGDE
jgi:hypothetical protein